MATKKTDDLADLLTTKVEKPTSRNDSLSTKSESEPVVSNTDDADLNTGGPVTRYDQEKPKSAMNGTAKKSSNATTFIIVGIVVFVIFVCCCASAFGAFFGLVGSASDIEDSSNNDPITDLDDDTSDVTFDGYSVSDIGELKTVGELDYTMHTVSATKNRLVVEMTVTNNGKYPIYFYSSTYMTLLDPVQDKTYYKDYAYSIPVSEQLEETIEAGATVRGKVAFKLTSQPDKLELTVKDGYFATSKATYTLTKD